MYIAVKDSKTIIIQRQEVELYEKCGWSIQDTGNNSPDPYYYQDVTKDRIEAIEINGEAFNGMTIYSTVNTKAYLGSAPERLSDGSMPTIADHDTITTPRLTVSFDYMSIEDYQRLIKAITPNEFYVTYYDFSIGRLVNWKMYIEPLELPKIHNVGYQIIATMGLNLTFTATLNAIEYKVISYYDSYLQEDEQYSLLNEVEKLPYLWYSIENGDQYIHGNTVIDDETPSNTKEYRFINWNTKPDGSGETYYPYQTLNADKDLILYAQWELI